MGSAALKPVKRSSLAESIAAQLREAIVSGQFAPGTPLAEPALAERLGVSRAPIREALIALEREGIVQFDERGRTRVRPLGPSDFEEICTLRIALEGLAGRWACRHWNAALAADLDEMIARQHDAKTIDELSRLDVDMHEMIVFAARHERLLAAWLVLRPQLEMWLTHTFQLQTNLHHDSREGTVRSHRELVQSLASGDDERAARAAAEHIDLWRTWQPALFRSQRADDTAR
jgi:DNA-binding GntR family transcriptional regulator